MYKIFFLGVIIFCSMGVGNVVVKDREGRITGIACLLRAAKILQNAMVLEGLPLSEGLYAAERVWPVGVCLRMAELVAQKPTLNGAEVFTLVTAENKTAIDSLKKQELQLFMEFMQKCSTAIAPEQISDAYQAFTRHMLPHQNSLKTAHQKTAKATKALCLCVGLAAAIILA